MLRLTHLLSKQLQCQGERGAGSIIFLSKITGWKHLGNLSGLCTSTRSVDIYIHIYINWRTCIHTYIHTLHCITLHYITLHYMTWHDMTWHDMTWHYIHSYIHTYMYTSSTAQGGGGSFKNRKPIGEVGCCESRMAQRSHWWTERWLRSLLFLSLFLSLSLTIYLPTHLSIYASIYLSLSVV